MFVGLPLQQLFIKCYQLALIIGRPSSSVPDSHAARVYMLVSSGLFPWLGQSWKWVFVDPIPNGPWWSLFVFFLIVWFSFPFYTLFGCSLTVCGSWPDGKWSLFAPSLVAGSIPARGKFGFNLFFISLFAGLSLGLGFDPSVTHLLFLFYFFKSPFILYPHFSDIC